MWNSKTQNRMRKFYENLLKCGSDSEDLGGALDLHFLQDPW